MSNPHEPLVTDYEVTWAEVPEGWLQDGEYLERGTIKLDNGYVVSLIRTNVDRDGIVPSWAEPEGKWEVVLVRESTNPMAKLLGMDFEPAMELQHLADTEVEGGFKLNSVDNAGLNALVATVGEQPAYVPEEGEADEFFEQMMGSMIAGLE